MYEKLNQYIRNHGGTPVKSNQNAAIYHLGFGKLAFICNTGMAVRLHLGYRDDLNRYGIGDKSDITYFESIEEQPFFSDEIFHYVGKNEYIDTDMGPTE